jgi:hypothetical protein
VPLTRAASGGSGAAIVAAVLLVIALCAAISVDVVKTGFGIKGDEATYVAMALSAAYDHDLTYQQQDLARFTGMYRSGPEGIFLKRGKHLRIGFGGRAPYVHLVKRPDPRSDRLYFGKPFIYSVAAAPFVRFAGLNGLLVFHVLLLFVVCVCGYQFLAARSRPGPALVFTLAFAGASVMPVYAVFLTPEIFNFALVFIAYFLWLYKEVAPAEGFRFLRGPSSDMIAAILLGFATYSKPTNALLIGPIVLLWWMRRHFVRGLVAGVVFAAAAGGLFGLTALSSGEFNYQGGDRKTFYGSFPFESPTRDIWAEKTELVTTNDADTGNVLESSQLASRVFYNVEYFLIGRHFGFVPYFFPGVVAVLAWLLSPRRLEPWRVMIALGAAGAALLLLLFLPYTWSGGGGPPGNRYFLGLYPVLFFLMPRALPWHGVLAFAGGALFTAKILVNPFVSAKNTWEIAERGFARRLPVELTMANDLPVMLAQPPRGHIPYHNGREVLLYFLDPHAFPPEPVGRRGDGSTIWGMWISGSGRAEIIVRADYPIDAIEVEAVSPIATTLTVSMGGDAVTRRLEPRQAVAFTVPADGVRGWRDFDYLLTARSSDGFVPRLLEPTSNDGRNLGAQIRFRPVTSAPTASGGTP